VIFKGCVLIVGGVMLAIPSDLLKRVSEANTFGFATYDHLADVGLVVGLLGAVVGGLYALVGAITARARPIVRPGHLDPRVFGRKRCEHRAGELRTQPDKRPVSPAA